MHNKVKNAQIFVTRPGYMRKLRTWGRIIFFSPTKSLFNVVNYIFNVVIYIFNVVVYIINVVEYKFKPYKRKFFDLLSRLSDKDNLILSNSFRLPRNPCP